MTAHLPGLAPPAKRPRMNGTQLQAAVIELAHALGYRVAHFRPAQTKHGWRTPVAADGAGFPDLILVRDQVIAIEVKGDGDKLTQEQTTWLDAFTIAGVPAHCIRPDDWFNGAVDELLLSVRAA